MKTVSGAGAVRLLARIFHPSICREGERAKKQALDAEDTDGRTGLFTSGVVSMREGRRLALFFSGRRHAGENLADVLQYRAKELQQPIQMCDALSRNFPGELQTIVANCLATAAVNSSMLRIVFPTSASTYSKR